MERGEIMERGIERYVVPSDSHAKNQDHNNKAVCGEIKVAFHPFLVPNTALVTTPQYWSLTQPWSRHPSTGP